MIDIRTSRLRLRELVPEDIDPLADMLADPEVMRFSVGGVRDRAGTQQFLDWCRDCYRDVGVGPWALELADTGDFVGFCGVGPDTVADREEINLGYRLARRYWGRGLATESVRAVLSEAFEQRRYDSVIAIVEPDHVASIRVIEKAGFGPGREADFSGHRVRLFRLYRERWCDLTDTDRAI
ncbi:GNAT family N-acetyltransferase [Marinobacter xestospongiae]|uniref:GNAT family N-acetyltransferase n=1 Tax=Marinobacter xestospongiae TaxID=994319 RepID=UPI002006A86B|nr:GNAT family N-acetyltransferase [Marinobacter xestospongiae]MCK7568980.1 GNAT family N-acetyltransferase [Marinobacter xestospongiae]